MGVAGRCGASVISFAFWVQLWLRLCYGLEPWCFLGWKCCTKARGLRSSSDAPEDDPVR